MSSSDGRGSPTSPVTPPSYAQRHYKIKKIDRGQNAHVYVSIPRTTADPIIQTLSALPPSARVVPHALLRNALEAAKIAKIGDCLAEIQMLRTINQPRPRPHVVQLRDPGSPRGSWFTGELFEGQTVGDFASMGYTLRPRRGSNAVPLPVEFAWHIILQICEASLEFHFGIVNGSPIPGATMFVHGDLHEKNIMFRRYPSAASTSHPDLVIIDVASAELVDHSDAGERIEWYRRQASEVVSVASGFGTLFRNHFDRGTAIRNALQELLTCDEDLDFSDENRELRDLLLRLRSQASQNAPFAQLPAEFLRQGHYMSDQELAAWVITKL